MLKRLWRRRESGRYAGYIDVATASHVSGWVCDLDNRSEPVRVEVLSHGESLGCVVADRPRPDLEALNYGANHGFRFESPRQVAAYTVGVRVAGSDFYLDRAAQDYEAPFTDGFLNSNRKGLPLLDVGASARQVDNRDVAIAREMLDAWPRARAPHGRSFVGDDTMWSGIVQHLHRDLIARLEGDDPHALAAYLVDVQKSDESDGLFQGRRAYEDFRNASPEGLRAAAAPMHDMLASLAQYLGAEPAECAEQGVAGDLLAKSAAALLRGIEDKLGFALTPPTVFDGLFGLLVKGDILHARDIQACYAARRALESSATARPHLCEIGGGFGRAAYYAWLSGVRRYTLIDLPTVAMLQYFTLRRSLPDAPIAIGESARLKGDGIDIVFASRVPEPWDPCFDLVLNCDSFPEMGDEGCRAYMRALRAWSPLLLSINQEARAPLNASGARQSYVSKLLAEEGFVRRSRFRSWIRKGYTDEVWASPQR